MPRRNGHVPAYRLHKPSGQARVIVGGEHVYLGKYGSPESREKYARLVSDLPAAKSNGRQFVQNGPNPTLSINELLLAYSQFAQSYYVKDGKPTKELACMAEANYSPQQYRTSGRETPNEDHSWQQRYACASMAGWIMAS